MHRCQLFCNNQGIYLAEYIQVTKYFHPSYSESLFLDAVEQSSLFFYVGILSQIFTIHRTAEHQPGTFDFLMQVANHKAWHSVEFALYTLALVATVVRRMLKTRVTLENISFSY